MKVSLLEEKIESFKNGERAAFDYIYESTHKPLYFSILYLVKDKMYAEDITHDAYLKAIASISSYRANTNFIAWLCRIGKNLALNFLERRKREISTDFTEAVQERGEEMKLPYLFEAAQKLLPEDEYQIVMMCQVAGYKRREVAEMFSMPIGTVTWKNNCALAKLKEYLKEERR